MRCPNVLAKIEEAKQLDSAGKCWCECVKEDIPKAEKLAADGKCGAANSVIAAALRRCDRSQTPGAFKPIQPISFADLKFGG